MNKRINLPNFEEVISNEIKQMLKELPTEIGAKLDINEDCWGLAKANIQYSHEGAREFLKEHANLIFKQTWQLPVPISFDDNEDVVRVIIHEFIEKWNYHTKLIFNKLIEFYINHQS